MPLAGDTLSLDSSAEDVPIADGLVTCFDSLMCAVRLVAATSYGWFKSP